MGVSPLDRNQTIFMQIDRDLSFVFNSIKSNKLNSDHILSVCQLIIEENSGPLDQSN